MAHPAYLREKARTLRVERKLTIDELAERLALSQRDRNRVQLGNSDEALLQVATLWIRRLSSRPMRFWIQFPADQDLSALRKFWSRALGIAPDAIHVQRKSNSAQLKGREWRSAHGVLSVHVNDTYLRARLQAWMDRLRSEWLQKPG